jgi:hypothetical protein
VERQLSRNRAEGTIYALTMIMIIYLRNEQLCEIVEICDFTSHGVQISIFLHFRNKRVVKLLSGNG